jgi:hypothetical protein
MRILETATLILMSALGATGCKSQADIICESYCACRGCDSSLEATCTDRIDLFMEAFDAAGCGPTGEAFFDCLEDHYECRDDGLQPTCVKQQGAVEACVGKPICIEQTAEGPCSVAGTGQ